jgi:hypothetical protein
VGAGGDAGRDDLSYGEGDLLLLFAPAPRPADVLVTQDSDRLAANPNRGVEQRADLARGQVRAQIARPLVMGRVLDRQYRSPADLLEVPRGLGVADLQAAVEGPDALVIAQLANDRIGKAEAPVAHAFDAQEVAVDPEDLPQALLPAFSRKGVQMDERLGARMQ